MRVFLIGFMGCGKSHVGKQLSARTGWQFVDLDNRIEMQEQFSIADIFNAVGETAFRIIEQAALHDMAQFDPIIVSCGGGTPCFFDNMDWMNQNGTTVYLQTPVSVLVERLRPNQAKRPLLQGLNDAALYAFVAAKLSERSPFYERAKIVYPVSQVREDVVSGLLERLGHPATE
jgi:shikimate kinase